VPPDAPIDSQQGARQRALRAIADTSRWDAPTEQRELDADCALDAMEAEGLIVVERAEVERLRAALRNIADVEPLPEAEAMRDSPMDEAIDTMHTIARQALASGRVDP
jgi:hypothetical protein